MGEAASPKDRETIREVISGQNGVERLIEVLTMATGPDSLLVAARVDLLDGLSSDDVERLSDQVEAELRQAVPAVHHVFLDPTPSHGLATAHEPRGRPHRPPSRADGGQTKQEEGDMGLASEGKTLRNEGRS